MMSTFNYRLLMAPLSDNGFNHCKFFEKGRYPDNLGMYSSLFKETLIK